MNKNYFIILLFLLISLNVFSMGPKEVLVLNESKLVDLILDSPPRLELSNLNEKKLEHHKRVVLDNFNTNLNISGLYSNSKEKPLTAFSPTTRYASQYKVSINKNFQSGVSISPYLYSDQITNDYIYQGSQTGLGIDINMDLYKNLFGKLTRERLQKIETQIKQSKINKELTQKQYIINIRKIFWSIVANQEAIKTSKLLLNGAYNLEKHSTKRFKNKITDQDEVFRNRSLVASRQSSITALKYKQEVLLQQIKLMLPKLAVTQVEFKQEQLHKKINEVMSCISLISTQNSVPYDFTIYDELLKAMQSQLESDSKIAGSYSQLDLSLMASARKNGSKVDGTIKAYDDFKDDAKTSYSIGLGLTIPLGGSKTTTKNTQNMILKRTFLAHKKDIEGRLKTSHTQILRSIKHLHNAIKSQQRNTSYLKKTLKFSKKKYKQARIPLRNLIIDENNYFQSNLIELDTKLQIIHILLDYLAIFTETPCDLNIKLSGKNV